MKVRDVVEQLGLQVRCGQERLEREVTGGYASDLLSDVMGHAKAGNLWITLQSHQNIVAVAALNELAGIILVNNREPEDVTLQKAQAEGVLLMVSGLSAFEVAGRLFQLGIRASDGSA